MINGSTKKVAPKCEKKESVAEKNEVGPPKVARESSSPKSSPMTEIGAKDDNFYLESMRQLLMLSEEESKTNDVALKGAMSFVKDIEPRNHVEAGLALQMAAVHKLAMTFAFRLGNASGLNELNTFETMFTKLNRTFISQMDALKRFRAPPDLVATVQNVSVGKGGQAIVSQLQNPVPLEDASPCLIEKSTPNALPLNKSVGTCVVPRPRSKRHD